MILATTTPATPPSTWQNIKSIASVLVSLPKTIMMIETAGLKCEPEYGAKVQINTVNPKKVAVLFASNIIALLSVRFSPIIPDPTTMRSKKKVPIVSETSFNITYSTHELELGY